MEVASEPELFFENNESSLANSVKSSRVQHGQMSRRLSGVTILSAYEVQTVPISDAREMAQFDALIDKFPKPPTNVEPNQARTTPGGGGAKPGWGIKGFAERFGLFSK
jgi:hypothetical protein